MKIYNQSLAKEYMDHYALINNGNYHNFNNLGGDCTNFASQVIFNGCCNTDCKSWYYKNLNDRTPTWTGVNQLYNFIIGNKGKGPHGYALDHYTKAGVGDLLQLSFDGESFEHSIMVYRIENGRIFIASHSHNRIDYDINNYQYEKIRAVHIVGYGE